MHGATWWLLCIAGALLFLLTACSGTTSDKAKGNAVADLTAERPPARYLGGGGGDRVLGAIVTDGETFLAYLCDGDATSAWFKGRVGPNGAVDVRNASGRTLRGVLGPDGFDGTWTDVDTTRAAVRMRNAANPTLFRLERPGALTGWVVLPDGRQTGATE